MVRFVAENYDGNAITIIIFLPQIYVMGREVWWKWKDDGIDTDWDGETIVVGV